MKKHYKNLVFRVDVPISYFNHELPDYEFSYGVNHNSMSIRRKMRKYYDGLNISENEIIDTLNNLRIPYRIHYFKWLPESNINQAIISVNIDTTTDKYSALVMYDYETHRDYFRSLHVCYDTIKWNRDLGLNITYRPIR